MSKLKYNSLKNKANRQLRVDKRTSNLVDINEKNKLYDNKIRPYCTKNKKLNKLNKF